MKDKRVGVRHIRLVVREGAKVDAVARGKVLEDVIGTNLVAAVRRIGNAVRQEQDVRHVAGLSP